jgi:hypothetical protein
VVEKIAVRRAAVQSAIAESLMSYGEAIVLNWGELFAISTQILGSWRIIPALPT